MKSLFLFLFSYNAIAIAQSSNSLDTHMDNTDRYRSGMNKLSPQEKKVLQEWIDTHHTLKDASTASDPNSPTQNGGYAGKGAVLSQNIAGGRYIELGDNSIWMINPEDIPTTAGWISPIDINVQPNPDSNWPYILVNSVTGSKARALTITNIPNIPSQSQPQQPNGITPMPSNS